MKPRSGAGSELAAQPRELWLGVTAFDAFQDLAVPDDDVPDVPLLTRGDEPGRWDDHQMMGARSDRSEDVAPESVRGGRGFPGLEHSVAVLIEKDSDPGDAPFRLQRRAPRLANSRLTYTRRGSA
jgi:hypothetical protein